MLCSFIHSDGLNEIDRRKEWEGVVLSSQMSSRGGVAVLSAKHFTLATFEMKQEM